MIVLNRAVERTAGALKEAQKLAAQAFESPAESTVMALFADICRNVEEIVSADELAADEDAGELSAAAHTLH